MHADAFECPPVHGHRRRNLDVGVIEGRELVFPVVVLELQEHRAHRAKVVNRRRRVRPDVGWRQRPSWRTVRAESEPAAEIELSAPPESRTRGIPLLAVQAPVLIPVVLVDELHLSIRSAESLPGKLGGEDARRYAD